MRILATIFFLTALLSVQAQKVSYTLKDYSLKSADLVLFTFGSDNPVKIGTVDEKGNLAVDLSTVQMPKLTNDIKDMYAFDLWNLFEFSCGNSDDFGAQGSISSFKGGNVALWLNKEWAGSFFLTSDQELISWLEDPGWNSAVKGVFWDIVYVDRDVILDLSCTSEVYLEDSNAEVSYTYKLNLKKGFNWVEYTIEDVYVTDPEVRASFPKKVRISNPQDPAKIMWMAKYFF